MGKDRIVVRDVSPETDGSQPVSKEHERKVIRTLTEFNKNELLQGVQALRERATETREEQESQYNNLVAGQKVQRKSLFRRFLELIT